jgi:D-arabinose 1-dehydrogenase-like Zn-dependent alcohol dehydrogenase
MPTTMRAVQVSQPGGDFELVERPVPAAGQGQVRVRVQACGICHSDMFAKENSMGATPYPIVPGHEIAGVIDEVGPDVVGSWQTGDRVGVGWFGGACHHCTPCRRGDLINCVNSGIPGITFDGGYADYVVVPADALAAVPEQLSAEEVGPLMCAGVTTYDALRKSPARPGDRVAVVGLGGLGHLGVQFAAKMGFEVVAVSRGTEKRDLARKLGATEHIDSTASDPGQALAEMGGATVVLSTAPSGEAASQLLPGLAPRGQLIVVGVGGDPLAVPPFSLIGGAASVAGHPSGTAADSEDTLRFAKLSDSRAMIETMPLERVGEAYRKMMTDEARFRMVLTM